MLDVRFIVENADLVKKAMATRSGSYDVDKVVELDKRRREIIGEGAQGKGFAAHIHRVCAKVQRGKEFLIIACRG